MISRRGVLVHGSALAVFSGAMARDVSLLNLEGSQEQGGLVIGRTLSDAVVTVEGKRVLVSPNGIFAFGLAYDAVKPVTFEGTVTLKSDTQIDGDLKATVTRSDFGLTIPNVPSVADVTDEVKLELQFTAMKQ